MNEKRAAGLADTIFAGFIGGVLTSRFGWEVGAPAVAFCMVVFGYLREIRYK